MKTNEKEIFDKLKEVLDPELNVNIVDLGLIYKVGVKDGTVKILMTLTTAGCPLAPMFEAMIKRAVKKTPGVKSVKVTVTFDPPWSPERMSPRSRKALGL